MKRFMQAFVIVVALGAGACAHAYSLKDDYEYAWCGWGGDCNGYFTPSQYYLNFEPNPQQYEPVDTYPMGYADVAPEWQNEAASWMAGAGVNPGYLWDGSGASGGDVMLVGDAGASCDDGGYFWFI